MSDDFVEYIIKVRYESEYKNVYIRKDDLTVNAFINYVFEAFQINTQGEVTVQLRDDMGILIPKNKVLQHIMAFWRNGTFFIDMSYSGDSNLRQIDLVTPRMIEDYFKQINQRDLLNECKGKIEHNVLSRQKIVQFAVDYMISTFGIDVKMFQRTMVANALIKLFPFIGFKDGKNIGLQTLLNGSNGGWLNQKYYYIRQAKRKQEQFEIMNANRELPLQVSDDEYNPKHDVELLKSLVVNAENLDTIKQKLNRTRAYRTQMMQKKETEIKEHFPYFFSHPLELIPMEFEEKYKNTEVNPNGLIENWSNYRKQLQRALSDHRKEEYESQWSPIVDGFLILLQLFPSKQVGRNVTASSANFEASIGKLIKFELSYTPPDQMAEASQSYPTIIACGNSETEIDYFCLKLEGKTIPVPDDATFLDVFDLFFKTHKIFDLNYEPSLRNMMIFVENFIYNLKNECTPTNRMLDVSRYFKNET